MQRLFRTIANLLFYGCILAFCLGFWAAVFSLVAHGDELPDVYVPFRWTVNTTRPLKQDIPINRGETVVLEPTYQSYNSPVDLSNVTDVLLRYRSADMAADTYYAATGSVTSATGGVVRVIWTPAQETTNTTFQYDIQLSGTNSASVKASGTIRLLGSITEPFTNQPTVVTGQFNWVATALPDVYVPFRWSVNTARPARQEITITRGETIALEPAYQSYDQPIDLRNVYDVRLRYRSADMAADTYYYAPGSVLDAAGGIVQIIWSPVQETASGVYAYDIKISGADSASLKASGTIRLTGSITETFTNHPPIINGQVNWAGVEHLNIDAAPFLDEGDLLDIQHQFEDQSGAISNVTGLVGDGVAVVMSNLVEHIDEQIIRDGGQDQAIAAAAAGATMGGDVVGQSSNAVVIKIQGQAISPITPTLGQTWIKHADGTMRPGSVDLSGVNTAISNLTATSASKSYVSNEISAVRGLVDGNDHTHQLTESFNDGDWLEIAANTWQHSRGWMAYNATLLAGQITLQADTGYLVMGGISNTISRIVTSPTPAIWAAQYATSVDGPWMGYDAIRDNIVSTNKFAVRFVNTGGTGLTISQVDLYTWTFPERVAFSRDFAGLHLLVDTPAGDQLREAVNVQYINNLTATKDISGTFPAGFNVDKIKGGAINNTARANGSGLIWYSSVNEHRYVDLATQFELDAAVSLLCTIASYNALQSRVAAAEAGTGVALNGDVVGSASSNRVVSLLGSPLPVGPVPAQVSLIMGSAGWELKSILGSNIVYAAGTNDIGNVPAGSAAIYRALYGTNYIMVLVLDQQIKGWFGADGLTIPQGTINLMQSNLTANVRMYDGTAAQPALSFVSDPATGWSRPAADTWRYTAVSNMVVDLTPSGIVMKPGKTVMLQDSSRAVSLAEITSGLPTTDPQAIHVSSTAVAWTNAGGTYTNESVVATSPLLTNGVAAVTYAQSGMMQIIVETSTNATDWAAMEPTNTPVYVRVSLADVVPYPGTNTTSISNIIATSWTRPDLIGRTNDTAGQIVLVDKATQARQPIQLAQLQAAVSTVNASTWSQYPATETTRLNNNQLRMGSAWTIQEVSEGLFISSYGTPFISFTASGGGISGLTVAGMSMTNLVATISISTNGVISDPMLQWSPSLMEQSWQTLTLDTSTYPSTNAAGYYESIATLPGPFGYVRAVQDAGTARVDIHAPLYVQDQPVLTGFRLSGTNLLFVVGGITNRIFMEILP